MKCNCTSEHVTITHAASARHSQADSIPSPPFHDPARALSHTHAQPRGPQNASGHSVYNTAVAVVGNTPTPRFTPRHTPAQERLDDVSSMLELAVSGYKTHRRDRSTHRGGTAILIKYGVNKKTFTITGFTHMESTRIIVRNNTTHVCMSTVYKPPNTPF
ncbi:hypothetical protein PR048_011133 [Dryococelus australis]|uniref:Uncharacterized protein n=1 Tax=Dryococelus australis TaxID=614101 RepID=A0ABQ9HKS3_9NEOP|nr:hypothetical protein PR048_011133 [Dryococelus australis]